MIFFGNRIRSHRTRVQQEPEALTHWAAHWKSGLNVSKRTSVEISWKNVIRSSHSVNGTALESVSKICNLGVVFNVKIGFKMRASQIGKPNRLTMTAKKCVLY